MEDYGTSYLEKKQILCKPLDCTWELNTYSTEQTTDSLCLSVVVGELYLGLIHVSCVMSHFSYCTVQSNRSRMAEWLDDHLGCPRSWVGTLLE